MQCYRIFLAICLAGLNISLGASGVPETVGDFDIEKYAGKWYQIAYLPNRFQSMCAKETQAEYTVLADHLKVINSCRDDNSVLHVAEGVARIGTKYRDPAKLEVRFAPDWLSFLPLVWGDYWVLDIDRLYTSVLVGSPDYRFLWILARETSISSEKYQELVEKAGRLGFDVSRLVR